MQYSLVPNFSGNVARKQSIQQDILAVGGTVPTERLLGYFKQEADDVMLDVRLMGEKGNEIKEKKREEGEGRVCAQYWVPDRGKMKTTVKIPVLWLVVDQDGFPCPSLPIS